MQVVTVFRHKDTVPCRNGGLETGAASQVELPGTCRICRSVRVRKMLGPNANLPLYVVCAADKL